MTKLLKRLPFVALLTVMLLPAFPVQKASAETKPAGVFTPKLKATFNSPLDGSTIYNNKETVSITIDRNGNDGIMDGIMGRNLIVELGVIYNSTLPSTILSVPELYRDHSITYSKPIKFGKVMETTIDLTFDNVPLTKGDNYIFVYIIDVATQEKHLAIDSQDKDASLKLISAANRAPVYRFWSPVFLGHFFTLDPSMINNTNLMKYWTFEGFAYYAEVEPGDENSKAVHRFWSEQFRHHFFTLDPSMRDNPELSKFWKYELIAFYATSEGAKKALPVYVFWSDQFRAHFFTLDDSMKNNPDLMKYWKFEGVAYYAYSL